MPMAFIKGKQYGLVLIETEDITGSGRDQNIRIKIKHPVVFNQQVRQPEFFK